jgi:Gp157 protein
MAATKKAYVPDARRDMHKEMAAAAALKHQLRECFGVDDHDVALIRDMIEGETNLDGAIDKVLEQMALDLANAAGIEKFATTMAARKQRLENRIETMRTMLLNALDILEEKRIERPIALLTKKPVPPKLLVVDEGEIPTRFFKQPDPVLSKKDLTDALKDRRDTLEQRLAEIRERREAGELDEDQATDAIGRLIAAFPAIPGAELDNGGATIQVRWS